MNSVLNDNIKDIRALKLILFSLRLKYDELDNESLRSDLKSIIQTGDKVYVELVQHSSKVSSAHKFIHIYLSTIDKIIDRYNSLVKNDIKSKESLKVQDEIVEFMPDVKNALIRYYESMFDAEILDTSVELEVLLQRL